MWLKDFLITDKELAASPAIATKEAPTSPDDYLIVGNKNVKGTWHLPVRRAGRPDHGLMGAAWAALHSGHRGNKYEGPGKSEAIAKLKKLYASEKMPLPNE